MENSAWATVKKKVTAIWESLVMKRGEDGTSEFGHEKLVVFTVSFILAFCLWLMVNLNRDFNLDINLPISVVNIPEDQALSKPLPASATVGISGEGWKLINIYNNPPSINLNVTQPEINLYDQVRQNMNALPDIRVQKVQPLMISADLEEKVTKSVPVISRVNMSFRDQYGLVGPVSVNPDSITVTGAASLVESITAWPTDSVEISDISDDISRTLGLTEPDDLIEINRTEVQITAPVEQFTEGEVRVNVVTRNLPVTSNVSFSPTSIRVKFDVPITHYADLEGRNIFEAYVTYEDLMDDSTGFVQPKIELREKVDYPINIRSHQPRHVAYFMVLDS